jgi:hypothetical protein
MLLLQNRFKIIKLYIAGLFFLISVLNPGQVWAAPFGQGAYGEGKYNVGEQPTSTSNPGNSDTSGSNNSKSDSTTNSNSCTNTAPTGTPNLFQIDRKGSTAMLYVAPGGNPYNSFFVSYGENGKTDQYAEYFNYTNSTGAMTHEIHELNPNVTYTFKVQPMNGCRAGEWSNTLSINKKNGKYYKYGPTQLGIALKSTASKIKNLTKSVKVGPEQPKATTSPESVPASTTGKEKPLASPVPQQNNAGFFGWFKGLFK